MKENQIKFELDTFLKDLSYPLVYFSLYIYMMFGYVFFFLEYTSFPYERKSN